MLITSAVLAEGEAGRAAVVGWIFLVVAVVVGLVVVAAAVSVGYEKAMDRIVRVAPMGSLTWLAALVGGIGLLALGFIFQIGGMIFLGVALLFVVWRISEHV